jgi:mono/diheme cytochrome c family protein
MRGRKWLALCLAFALALMMIALSGVKPLAGQEDDPFEDPLVLGAWLYEGNCVRCHGGYESARLASGLDEDDLIEAIEGGRGGCQVDWARSSGGPFGARQIKSVVAYMLAWEKGGGPPDLPALPPQPTPTPMPAPQGDEVLEPTPTPTPAMSEEVKQAVEGSSLALGAYLYTANCYRCHLAYDRARMGKGISLETLERTIANGKSATSMKPFSRRKGGDLRLAEIKAIVGYIAAWEKLDEAPALPEVLFTPPTPDPAKMLPVLPPDVPPVVGDARRGAESYAVYCAPCHGVEGEGALGPALARPWYGLRPDLTIRSTIQRGAPGSIMPRWSDTYGGPLDDQQIDDLVALLLGWAPAR